MSGAERKGADRVSLDVGSLAFPADWERKVSATLAMPATAMPVMRPGKQGETKSPQPNLVVTVIEGEASPDDALTKVIDALAAALPGLVLGEKQDFAFDDGATGRACQVTFQAGGASVTQLHILRAGPSLTHLVATAPAARTQDLEVLGKVARSFAPKA